MNHELLSWFGASAVVIGSLISIFKPDNTVCPLDLPAKYRVMICVVLGGVQMTLQSLYSGSTWQQSVITSVASVITALLANGSSSLDVKV